MNWDALKSANQPLNAFTDFDQSAKGGEGALAGLTIGVKANIAVKGLPWTAGTVLYRNRIAENDAEAVAKLRQAGALILGTVNLEEAALGAKTDNPWFGATQNPHRLGYTPGGSSGGSAAAVAAGLCDAALGTDTMGSIRIPAAYCGVYGFKPANAAVSQHGLEPAEPSLDVIGPLARDLDTLERVARVMSDFGERQSAGTVTTLADFGGVECEAVVSAAFEKARAVITAPHLSPEGVGLVLTTPLSRLRFAGFIATSRAMATHLADADPALLSPALAKLLTYGPRRSDADWAEDQRLLREGRDEIKAIVAHSGFLLMPTTPQPAFPHSEAAPANQADLTCLANIGGLPAISLPGGWSEDGLPIGVQLVGQVGHEAHLFALARHLDRALAAYRPPANFGY